MTLQELINVISLHPNTILAYYAVIVALAIIFSLYIDKENFKSPFTYIYSVLVYAVSIPAMLSTILIIYGLFFRHTDFLQVDILSYFLPLVVLIFIMILFNKTVGLSQIPGFGRISGLFVMIVLSFLVTYFIQKTFIGIFFIGSFKTLLILFLGVLVLMKLAWNKIFQ